MTSLTLAVDWTPNINHIGFYTALDKGYYKDAGLHVSIVDPSKDNYKTTPAKKVEQGMAHFALCPTESVISYRTKSKAFPLIGIAAILKQDLSAIAVKKSSGILRPSQLDGKTYSSYQARYEDMIVKQMIRNDGGRGELDIAYPEKLGIWNTVRNGAFDATWIFLNWEGVAVESLPESYTYFKMADFQVPYSYSPVLVANEPWAHDHSKTCSQFLQASKKGFEFCRDHPQEAIQLFAPHVPIEDAHINLEKALQVSLDSFNIGEDWGHFEHKTVAKFLAWIYDNNLEKQQIEASDLYTNTYLP